MVLTTQLLWFLGAYLLVTALTPLFVATTPARGAVVALALVAACGARRRARASCWGWPEAIGLVNFVLVWTVPAYLGSLRAHGTLARIPWPALVGTLVAGLAVERHAHQVRAVAGLDGGHARRAGEQHGTAHGRAGRPRRGAGLPSSRWPTRRCAACSRSRRSGDRSPASTCAP